MFVLCSWHRSIIQESQGCYGSSQCAVGISGYCLYFCASLRYFLSSTIVPEAPNDDLREVAAQRPENRAKVLNFRTCNVNFGLGIWSMFFYVAGHEAHAVNFEDYVTFSDPR
jgi:hypothetical protein